MVAAGRQNPKNISPLGPGRFELRCPQEASGSAHSVVPCRGGRDQVSTSVQSAASAVVASLTQAGMLASSRPLQVRIRIWVGAPSGWSLPSATVTR
jgi:hypothetical protein